MRIISNKALQEFADLHPQALVPLQEWLGKIRTATIKSYTELKNFFVSFLNSSLGTRQKTRLAKSGNAHISSLYF